MRDEFLDCMVSNSRMAARAAPLHVEMPLCEAVTEVLSGRLTPPQALERLMTREARSES